MNAMNIRVTGLVFVAIIVAGAPGLQAQTVDLSGAWTFTVTTDTGVTYPEVMLEQDGDRLSGNYSSDALGKSPVSGHLRGSEMTFMFSTDVGGGQMAPVVYTGTLQDDGAIVGTMDIGGGLLLGTFTAARSEH